MIEQYFYEKELDRIVNRWQVTHPERVGLFAEQYLKQGFSDEDTWDLRLHLAELILPRLKRYRELASKVIKIDWELDETIEAFEYLIQCEGKVFLMQKDKTAWWKFQSGMESFSRYYLNLWW